MGKKALSSLATILALVICTSTQAQVSAGNIVKNVAPKSGLERQKKKPAKPLKIVVPKENARALQTVLKDYKCYNLAVDGAWGPASRSALSHYIAIAPASAKVTSQTPVDELVEILRSNPVTCKTRPKPSVRNPIGSIKAKRTSGRRAASNPARKSSGGLRFDDCPGPGCPARTAPAVGARKGIATGVFR